MDIIPHVGIGGLRFGTKRDEIRAILGSDQTWEAWMGGNLNDSLFYPGIILFFDKYDSHGPMVNGRLVQIAVSSEYPCKLFGCEMKNVTRNFVVSSIAPSEHSRFPPHYFRSEELEMHFFFKPDGALSNLSLADGSEAQQSLAADAFKATRV
jgi:hypothetical protein